MPRFFSTKPLQVRRSDGFTLIETLIVLGIIAVLASILLPVFFNARESGRRATCSSNLKQIGLAMMLYSQSNNGFYLPTKTLSLGMDHDCSWASPLEPYVKTAKVFECPSASVQQIGNTHFSNQYRSGCPAAEVVEEDGAKQTTQYWGSYDLNAPGASPLDPLRDSSFKRPTFTGLVVDGRGAVNVRGQLIVVKDGGTFTMYGLPRHRNGANILFADGHVKWLNDDAMHQPEMWILQGAS